MILTTIHQLRFVLSLACGQKPSGLRLKRSAVGGEVVTEGLKTRARQLFSDVTYVSNRTDDIRYNLGGPMQQGIDLAARDVDDSGEMLRMDQQIRFGISPDGVRIAYAAVGKGSPLVKAANWLSHLEFDWNSPVWRHWLKELSRYHTLVRYDERGCGLSDRHIEDFSVDAWVRDLETVVDALGLERFPLLGLSQGGPVAITYAVRHPERVSHLILYGTYARGRARRYDLPEQPEVAQTQLNLIRLGWAQDNPAYRRVFVTMFIPDATPAQVRWFDELQRISTLPENALRFEKAFQQIDVTDLAVQVCVPTFVLHAKQDGVVPFEEGRRLAALIPDARFVPLDSRNHLLLEDEPAWARFLAEIRSFLGVPQQPERSQQTFSELTEREREVALLIAEGKSNREIAAALIITERTVEGHVSNILSKLGFRSRAQISAWVVENGRSDR